MSTSFHFLGGILYLAHPQPAAVKLTHFITLVLFAVQMSVIHVTFHGYPPCQGTWLNRVLQASIPIWPACLSGGTDLAGHCPFCLLDLVVVVKFEAQLFSQGAFLGEAKLQVETALLSDRRPVVLTLKSASKFPGNVPKWREYDLAGRGYIQEPAFLRNSGNDSGGGHTEKPYPLFLKLHLQKHPKTALCALSIEH